MNCYKYLLKKFPLPTRMATAGTVLGSADFLYQKFYEKREQINYKRIKTNAAIGCFAMAPFLSLWFKKIHPSILKSMNVQKNTKSYYCLSLLADSLIFFPAAQFLYHFSFEQIYNNYLMQNNTDNWIQKDKCYYSLGNYYKIWIPVCLFYYCFVPVIFRPLIANFSMTSWNQYVNLSLK